MYGQGPYGHGYPAPPGLSQVEVHVPRRTTSVNVAFVLWLCSSALGLTSGVFSLLLLGEAERRAGWAFSESTKLAIGGIGLLVTAGMIVLVFVMRAGRNWARILLTVLGGFTVFNGLMGLAAVPAAVQFGGTTAALVVIAPVQAVLCLGAIVCMYVGGANQYFAFR